PISSASRIRAYRSVIAHLSIQYGTFQHLVERGLPFSVDHRECSTDELLPRAVIRHPLRLVEKHNRGARCAVLHPQCVGLANALDRAAQENFQSFSCASAALAIWCMSPSRAVSATGSGRIAKFIAVRF